MDRRIDLDCLAQQFAALAFSIALLSPAGVGAQSSRVFDLDQALRSIVRIDTRVPADARTAQGLGRERAGNGVVIDSTGLVLTIGYLILEANEITLTDAKGTQVPADIMAYDHQTGFGLVRALRPLEAESIRLGDAKSLTKGEPILIAAHGGRAQVVGAFVVSRREFAGYWEYLLESAIFTSPPHPNWAGSALIGRDGRLLGVGSLLVGDALRGEQTLPGNMFVPIDILKPILADLLNNGGANRPRRPWLGMFSADADEKIVVTRVAPGGPAARAGILPGDQILAVAGSRVENVADMYRKVWALGGPGIAVAVTVSRDLSVRDITVHSGNRYKYLKLSHDY